jgi:hypothetical protein
MNNESQNKLTPLGVIVSLLMVLGLVGVGGYVLLNKKPTPNTRPI